MNKEFCFQKWPLGSVLMRTIWHLYRVHLETWLTPPNFGIWRPIVTNRLLLFAKLQDASTSFVSCSFSSVAPSLSFLMSIPLAKVRSLPLLPRIVRTASNCFDQNQNLHRCNSASDWGCVWDGCVLGYVFEWENVRIHLIIHRDLGFYWAGRVSERDGEQGACSGLWNRVGSRRTCMGAGYEEEMGRSCCE